MLLDILEEHLEEAEILWSRRRAAVRSPDLDLSGLDALEKRLAAHLEGLVLGLREAPGAEDRALRGRDADAAFAAAATLLTSGEPGSRRSVFEAFDSAPPQARQGIVEALCHLPLADPSRVALEARLGGAGAPDPVALEVLSFHRCLAPGRLQSGARAMDRAARRAVARALGRARGEDARIRRLAEDMDAGVRDAALSAAARSGLPWTLGRLRSICRDPKRATTESIRLLACIGDKTDIDTVRTCAAREELGEAAVAGLGTLGYVECADALVACLANSRLSRGAGRAFRRITGLEPLAVEDKYDSPEAEDSGFEDLRPEPDPEPTGALWRRRRRDFDPGTRWRNGKPVTTASRRAFAHHGDLMTRREELTRLWWREPDLFAELELDAPAARQRAVVA